MKRISDHEYELEIGFKDQDLSKLKSIVENNEIEVLNLKDFDDYDDEELWETIANNPNLKALNFSHILEPIHDPTLKMEVLLIESLLKLNKIEKLTFDYLRSKIEKNIFQILEENTSLRYLKITTKNPLNYDELISLQKMLNKNTNLKTFILLEKNREFEVNEKDPEKILSLSPFYSRLNDSFSLVELVLSQDKRIEHYSFLKKFQALQRIRIEPWVYYNFESLVNNISKQTNPFLKSIELYVRDEIQNEIDFSKTSITEFNFHIPNHHNSLFHIMKSLKNVKFLKSLHINYSSEERSEWQSILSEILEKSKYIETLYISNYRSPKDEFNIIYQGLEKNESLTYLSLHLSSTSKVEELGKILTSKTNLKKLYLCSIDFNWTQFFINFQNNCTLKHLEIERGITDQKTAFLISNFLKNNNSMESLSLKHILIKDDDNQLLLKAIETHSNLTSLNIKVNYDNYENFIKVEPLVNIILNNKKLKEISINYLQNTKQQDLVTIFEALMKNNTLKKFNSESINDERRYMKLVHEYLFYNYTLIDFSCFSNNFTVHYFPYHLRNFEFNQKIYKPSQKMFDINFYFDGS